MEIFILFLILLGIAVSIIAYGVRSSSENAAFRQDAIERRKAYAESLSPTARIIVNNGIHLFFKDDATQTFGFDESGKMYNYSGLHSVSVYKDAISFMHMDAKDVTIGKSVRNQETTFPLDSISITAIKAELMPILRKNLYVELEKAGVSPTHEYEHDGEIWGCDINSKKFYVASGAFSIYNFSDMRRVTIEDLRNNSLYDGSYIIHVYVKWDGFDDDFDYQIHFNLKDSTFNNLLAMFKGIQNRKYK